MTALPSKTDASATFPTRIQTERLVLRAMLESDAEAMFTRYASDPEVTRYLSFPTHKSLDDTRQFLAEGLPETRGNGGEVWIIEPRVEPRDGGPLIGAIGARVFGGYRVDFGYSLARDCWGQGFATEASKAVILAGFELPHIWRVQALCDVEHRASARVLEKAGLEFEGTLRRYWRLPNRSDEPRDMHCYAKGRE